MKNNYELELYVGDIVQAKFEPAFSDAVEVIGRIREFKGQMICCNELYSGSPFFCLKEEMVKVDLPETTIRSLGEVP